MVKTQNGETVLYLFCITYKSEICILGTIDSIHRENWLNFFYLTKVAAAATTLALEMSNMSKIFATKKLLRHNFNAQDLVLIFTKALDGLVYTGRMVY